MNILDYRDKDIYMALDLFSHIIEEVRADNSTEDYTILTNDNQVQGSLLELIDREELEHRIELGGKVYVTVS
jgi:hypothetical protein